MCNQNIVNIIQDALKAKQLAQIPLTDKTVINCFDALKCINVTQRANIILSNV